MLKRHPRAKSLYRTWVSLIKPMGLTSKIHFNRSTGVPCAQFLLSCSHFPALSLCLLSLLQTDTRHWENVYQERLLGSDSSPPLWAAPWKTEAAWPWHLHLNRSPIPPLNPHLRSSLERKVSSIWRLFRERLNHLMMSHVKIKLMQMLIWQPKSVERVAARPQALCFPWPGGGFAAGKHGVGEPSLHQTYLFFPESDLSQVSCRRGISAKTLYHHCVTVWQYSWSVALILGCWIFLLPASKALDAALPAELQSSWTLAALLINH